MYHTFIFISEPLGGVRNLRVTDPTTSTLNVLWEAAEGNVRQYRIFYVPAAGGEEEMVNWLTRTDEFWLNALPYLIWLQH